MARACDPLGVQCPEPECQAKIGERCDPDARRVSVDPITGKELSRRLDLVIGQPETYWHYRRYLVAREKGLAAEPKDDRPWCERSLTSIAAEFDRLMKWAAAWEEEHRG